MTQTAPPTMNTWNTVTLTGNLGKDPEMSYTPNGNAVTKFSLAVSQGKDKPPMWLSVECWKQLAEQCNSKLSKGIRIELTGRLAQDVWEDKVSKKKRYALKVVAQTVKPVKYADKRSPSGFLEADTDNDPLGDLEGHPF